MTRQILTASEKSEENTIVDLIISERKRRRQTDQARLLSCLLHSQTTDLFNKRLSSLCEPPVSTIIITRCYFACECKWRWIGWTAEFQVQK